MTMAPDSITLGSLVASDYRVGAVLDRFGLDFCCGGRRTLGEACEQQSVDIAQVRRALDALASTEVRDVPDDTWAADALARYIVARHHRYVREQVPVIAAHLARLQQAHGVRHPELAAVSARFGHVAGELAMHLRKEEEILFPYITALAAAVQSGAPAPPNMFGTVANPIRMMEAEHQGAGNELELLKALTGNFTVPEDGCPTYRACFEELQAFDRDLRTHIHLENNILFPKAVALEELVMGARRG